MGTLWLTQINSYVMQGKNLCTKEPTMPRTQRLIINDESTVYHAWDVEPDFTALPSS